MEGVDGWCARGWKLYLRHCLRESVIYAAALIPILCMKIGPFPPTQSRYEVPNELGIFRLLPSASPEMSARNIIHRIVNKRQEFEARNAKKVVSEAKYYQASKAYVQEL